MCAQATMDIFQNLRLGNQVSRQTDLPCCDWTHRGGLHWESHSRSVVVTRSLSRACSFTGTCGSVKKVYVVTCP